MSLIVLSSKNGRVGIRQAMAVLQAGGSAMDAVETGIRFVEDNQDDHSVGVGGYPNILGEVELDASIMDGQSLMAGAVGGLKGYPHPISIARKVMERLPHVLLVGDGAARFADECGFEKSELFTPATRKKWQEMLAKVLPAEVIEDLRRRKDLGHWVIQATNAPEIKGTVNFIARDRRGNICCGVSTSGWSAKYPGRLGDSPVIGAGNYADNRYGAAACTGMGEMAIRSATAHSLVLYMKMGLTLEQAGRQAMQDLNDLGGDYLSEMNIVAMDKDGTVSGFTNTLGNTFIIMKDNAPNIIEIERLYVGTRQCWGKDETSA